MAAQHQTEEISKTIALLKFETIRESLKLAKCKSAGTKPALVKNYEAAVLDVGIEKFVGRLSDDLVSTTAKLVNVETGANQSLKEGLTEAIQSAGLNSVLGKADEDLLKKFSTALGLEDETSDTAKKIEDEVMLIGMEGFLQKLNPDILRKHCAELNLPKSGAKSDLVEKLMVHIFELEPLNDKKEAPLPIQEKVADKEKEKEEAKPKENKKRKAEPKEKKVKKPEEKEDASNGQRPKRSAATKKKVDEDAEERPAKKQKKEGVPASPKKEKKEKPTSKKEVVARTPRTPFVAPPLSTIVKGQYSGPEFHNKFNLTDLQKYAKQEGLKSSGQKKKLIKRIINYLETGKKDEKKESKKGKPKAKNTKVKKPSGTNKKKVPKDKEKAVESSTDNKSAAETKV